MNKQVSILILYIHTLKHVCIYTLIHVHVHTYILYLLNSLDSAEAIQLIDSAYVQARQVDIRDSAFVTDIIDSAYIIARQEDNQRDSAFVTSIVDSDYVQTENQLPTFLQIAWSSPNFFIYDFARLAPASKYLLKLTGCPLLVES